MCYKVTKPAAFGGSTVPIAKLLKIGRSQAVRLPAEFRFESSEVTIRRDPETGEVILRPYNRKFAELLKLSDKLIAEDPEAFASFEIPRDSSPDELVQERLTQLGITETDIGAARRPAQGSVRHAPSETRSVGIQATSSAKRRRSASADS